MGKYLKIYTPFINAGMQEAVSYRINWLFVVFGNILGCFVSFFLWSAVYASTDGNTFMGFEYEQMIIYIFLTFLTSYIIGSGGTYDIGMEIKDGSIAMRLLKPISYNSTFLFQEFGSKMINIIILFIPLMAGVEIYRYHITGSVQFEIGRFLVYILSAFIAYLISFFFNICYGFTAFVFKNLWGSNMMKNCLVGFLSGNIIPIKFLPVAMANVLVYLPFASLNYTPVMIYMGIYNGAYMWFQILLQIVWCVFFWILTKVIWKCVIKHLTIQGG